MPLDHLTHLDIGPIVAELRNLREHSLAQRQRECRPPKLPSRSVLRDIVEGLATAMYPNRLGSGEQTHEGIDYYVGHILDAKLRLLVGQIQRELRFAAEQAGKLEPDAECCRQEALERARSERPDLILLDVMMPRKNGYEVCQAIRANPDWRTVRIIMLTAKGREVEREKGLALGADDYITKPFSTQEVVERVRELLTSTD